MENNQVEEFVFKYGKVTYDSAAYFKQPKET